VNTTGQLAWPPADEARRGWAEFVMSVRSLNWTRAAGMSVGALLRVTVVFEAATAAGS